MKRIVLFIFVIVAGLGAMDDNLVAAAEFSDEAVEKAIEKAVEYLWSQQQPDGSWPGNEAYPVGYTALPAYALLESGVNPQDSRMAKALKFLATTKTTKTYGLGLRANAFLVAMRTDKKWMQPLRKDVELLYKSTRDGSYGYVSVGEGRSSGDNSNSQYGLLGVWAGAQANLEIPRRYWYTVMKHWVDCQNSDGGWTYMGISPTRATMTAAGVASLFVCFDNFFLDAFVKCDTGLEFAPVKRGLDWFDRRFAGTLGMGHYYLYGVERVGLASGYKYFGTSDWYKMGAAYLLGTQRPDGSWVGGHGDAVNTAFAILFLVRGRHAVLFNKLQFDGDWNNRPRDLASLTRWISRTFETTVNWQIINLRVAVREWHDAPILYISASKAPTFSDEEIQKLRTFVWQGGTIFSAVECMGKGFKKGIRELYAKLFPDYELTPCGPEHELYSVYFKLRGRPQFHMISNGVRPLVVHTDVDLPLSWQLQNIATQKWAFEGAANIFMYVTDKGALRHRGTSLWPAERRDFTPSRTIKLARLKHAGNYDPEPLAYERFRLLMARDTQTRLEVLGPMEIGALASSGAKIAALTGVGRLQLTAGQQDALKEWVAAGGTLIVDAAGGSKDFAESAEALLRKMYGPDAIRRLARTSPIFQPPAFKELSIDRVRYRRRARQRLGGLRAPNLRAVLIGDRPAIIFSREDLTAGLVGYPAYTCDGYEPNSAYQIMRNLVLYASGATSKQPEGQDD